MFSKRHYEVIAETIAQLPNPSVRMSVAQAFADRLAPDNAKFNRSKFIKAASGVEAAAKHKSEKETYLAQREDRRRKRVADGITEISHLLKK